MKSHVVRYKKNKKNNNNIFKVNVEKREYNGLSSAEDRVWSK